MKEVILRPQESDMGSGYGYIEGAEGRTLREVLDFCSEKIKAWGVVDILKDSTMLRKFDYNTYNDNIFYHLLAGWEYTLKVKEASFDYCFMNKNITIILR